MGIPGQVFRQEAHLFDHGLNPPDPVRLILVQMEIVQALGNDIVHCRPFVQGCGGILENHLDVPDHFPVQGLGDFPGNTDALVKDLACGAGIDPDYRPADRRLSRAGFSDQGERLALQNIERRVFDRADRIVPFSEGDVHILQGQQYLAAFLVQRAVLRQRCRGVCQFLSHAFSSSVSVIICPCPAQM